MKVTACWLSSVAEPSTGTRITSVVITTNTPAASPARRHSQRARRLWSGARKTATAAATVKVRKKWRKTRKARNRTISRNVSSGASRLRWRRSPGRLVTGSGMAAICRAA